MLFTSVAISGLDNFDPESSFMLAGAFAEHSKIKRLHSLRDKKNLRKMPLEMKLLAHDVFLSKETMA